MFGHKRAEVPSLVSGSSSSIQSSYDSSFAVVGPRLWNVLPGPLTIIFSSSEFKTKSTKFLAELIDEPPVTGYVRRHNNTLMEVSALNHL